jgi:WD40 repeat protein
MPFEKVVTITEDDSITSIQVNHSGTQVLTAVSLSNPVRIIQKINLWSVSGNLIQTFEGFIQEKFIIRPCFAGPSEDLVLMGSENGKIHVWSKLHGSPLGVINAHNGPVNALAMSCLDLSSVISCSDDGTLKLWNMNPLTRD